MSLPGSLRRYSNFVRVWGFLWYTNVSGLGPVYIKITCAGYNKNGSWKYHFNQYELNVNIYKCFRTGASQSKHNMCGSRNFFIRGGGGGSRPDGKKTALTAFFLFVCFLFVLCSPQPINRGVPMVLFQRGSIFSNFFQELGGGGSKC